MRDIPVQVDLHEFRIGPTGSVEPASEQAVVPTAAISVAAKILANLICDFIVIILISSADGQGINPIQFTRSRIHSEMNRNAWLMFCSSELPSPMQNLADNLHFGCLEGQRERILLICHRTGTEVKASYFRLTDTSLPSAWFSV